MIGNSYIDNKSRLGGGMADLGGRRVLGMGSSLKGYIATGNQYHQDYIPIGYKKKARKQSFLDKIPSYIAPALAIAGALTLAVGVIKGKIKIKDIPSKISNKVKNFNIKDVKKGMEEKVKNFNIKDLKNGMEEKVKKLNPQGKFENISNWFKNKFKKP